LTTLATDNQIFIKRMTEYILTKNNSKLLLKLMSLDNKSHIRFSTLNVDNENKIIVLKASYTNAFAKCPYCSKSSKKVRSSYVRTIQSLSILSYSCKIEMTTRRFVCANKKCFRKIFSEQYQTFVKRYSRLDNNLCKVLSKIFLEISARKGSYISGLINVTRSPSSCLRMILKENIPNKFNLEHIGIDDWAFKKGRNYGTIVVNTLTGKAIDLLDSRDSQDVGEYLRQYKNLKTVTRDRASAYSNAIKMHHSNIHQIADKFHLVKNLGDNIYHIIKINYNKILKELNYEDEPKIIDNHYKFTVKPKIDSSSQCIISHTIKQKRTFKQVKELRAKNYSINAISRILKMHKTTVMKYIKLDRLPIQIRPIRNSITPYIKIINDCCNKLMKVDDIYDKVKSMGYNRTKSAFRHNIAIFYPNYSKDRRNINKYRYDISEIKDSNQKVLISPAKLSIYLTTKSFGINKLTNKVSEEYEFAHDIINKSNILKELQSLSDRFRSILKNRDKVKLLKWLKDCSKCKYRKLVNFAKKINEDLQPVLNALKYKYSNGVVEGNVNRLKTIKRALYGRASIKLLKRKVCLSKMG